MMNIFTEKNILVTGGTGSFGQAFTRRLLERYPDFARLILYSRDEFKQYRMKQNLTRQYGSEKIKKIRFFIGDVRDASRLRQAFDSVDYVIHAAAMKHVPVCEHNPFEAVQTNIHGAQNIIEAAVCRNVSKVVALSTDKAVNPSSLYGGTKLISDRLMISANEPFPVKRTVFSIVRYGNVAGSRGSVIPLFRSLIAKGNHDLPITDRRMTRFWITLEQGVDLIIKALQESKGGETYISKIPSFYIADLAKAIGGETIDLNETGVREGEKIHEIMITPEDSARTFEYEKHYIIYPPFEWWDMEKYNVPGGRPVPPGFEYSSNNNTEWLSVKDLQKALSEVK